MRPKLKRLLYGSPRDVESPSTYHSISLIALLAWVGLGADGLSSSAYGPDEAFRALGQHTYLAIALAVATTITVLVISIAYSQIIKRFPFGGGGYIVATELLGPRWGVVSGSALLVDYVLTISVSIASGADQVFSVLPLGAARWKLILEGVVIFILILLNLRGVRESVTILAPIFGLFLLTHAVLLIGGIGMHAHQIPAVASGVQHGFQSGLSTLGLVGMFGVFLRAYSMGAGTYTGIEAVSNGLQIMREPKVQTARRTMTLMAISLAVTAGGLLVLYLLFNARPVEGKTMNAVLLDAFAGRWSIGGYHVGWIHSANAGRGSGAPVRGRAGGVHRWPPRHVQHGDGLLAPPPLRSALEPSHHQQWRVPHGRGGDSNAVVHARESGSARHDVLDQRLRDLLAFPARNVSHVASPTG